MNDVKQAQLIAILVETDRLNHEIEVLNASKELKVERLETLGYDLKELEEGS